MYPRIQVNQWNWPHYLADKVGKHWKETGNHRYTLSPFVVPRSTDADVAYATLPAKQRCAYMRGESRP